MQKMYSLKFSNWNVSLSKQVIDFICTGEKQTVSDNKNKTNNGHIIYLEWERYNRKTICLYLDISMIDFFLVQDQVQSKEIRDPTFVNPNQYGL